jgi:hypothetical protein
VTASQWEIDGVASGDWIAIGGHSNAQGAMRAYRTTEGVWKVTADEYNEAALRNEADMLQRMGRNGHAPELLEIYSGDDPARDPIRYAILQSDAGVTDPIIDGEKFRREMIRLVGAVRARELRHGDLTAPNLVFHNDRPVLLDWQESHPLGEKGPQKQPWTDSFMAMRVVAGTADTAGQMDTPRVARRWMAVLTELGATIHRGGLPLAGQTFMDFGCFMGDFAALAEIEGMESFGVDAGGFRTGENSIEIGQEIWRDLLPHEPRLTQFDIFEWVAETIVNLGDFVEPEWDVSMMFSTFPYLVQQRGWTRAEALIGEIIALSGAFFFECQLAGDGPGPPEFHDDDAIAEWLGQWGTVKALVTIPVTGRPASRTVFVVRKD